jgi:hypothetical protein
MSAKREMNHESQRERERAMSDDAMRKKHLNANKADRVREERDATGLKQENIESRSIVEEITMNATRRETTKKE